MGFRFRVLGSGSTGNCTLVEAGDTALLIDAGLGPRSLAERVQAAGVDPARLAAILLTHEHADHAKGAAAFSAKWGVPLWGSRGTYAALGLGAEEIPHYQSIEAGASRSFDGVTVTAIGVPHDAAAPLAFRVRHAEVALGHATDLGHVNRAVADAFAECDALLIESNYDPQLLARGPYPWPLKERILSPEGHLGNGDVAAYLQHRLGVACRRVVLAHVSEKNNDAELALRCAESALSRAGRYDVVLQTAPREGTGWLEVGSPAQGASRQLRLWP